MGEGASFGTVAWETSQWEHLKKASSFLPQLSAPSSSSIMGGAGEDLLQLYYSFD